MPKIKCISVAGIELWFWSDDHNPPHFHAKRAGQWEVKVKFLESGSGMLEVVWAKKAMSKQDRRQLIVEVESHRQEILKEWEAKVQK